MQVLQRSSSVLRRSVNKVLRRQFNKTAFREPDPSKPKIVLAYSGGLDTSCQLSWLAKEKGFEVCAYIADLGQDDVLNPKDVEEICAKAEQSGAYAFYCEDLRKDFVENYIFKSIKGNGLYENRYLLGTSVARPCIGKRQVEICWEEGAKHISHGSTGKGNDQVRFELCYLGMDHSLDCVTLWRDPEYLSKFEGRQDLIDYATTQNIPISQTKKHSYSEDENMMHISYESGELEDPAFPGHENEYPGMVLKKKSVGVMEAPDEPAKLTLDFQAGVPVRVKNFDDGTEISESVQMYVCNNVSCDHVVCVPLIYQTQHRYEYLNKIGGEHGVGRVDIVENRFIGMKSRGCYESPAATILHHGLRDLEVCGVRASNTT